MVGNENTLRPLIDYLEPLLRFQERQKEEGIDIPFFFHAGETLGDGTAADDNLYDAILMGTKRIGHGSVQRCPMYSSPTHPAVSRLSNTRSSLRFAGRRVSHLRCARYRMFLHWICRPRSLRCDGVGTKFWCEHLIVHHRDRCTDLRTAFDVFYAYAPSSDPAEQWSSRCSVFR